MHVILIFTYGISLKAWDDSGILKREIEIYKRLSKDEKIRFTFVTFGDIEDQKYSELFDNLTILPIYKYINKSKSRILDVIKTAFIAGKVKNILPKKAIIKTNQLNGAWVGIYMKFIMKYPLYLRTGYNLFEFSVKNKKNTLIKLFHYILTQVALLVSDIYVVTSKADKEYLKKYFFKANQILLIPNWILDIKKNSFENRYPKKVFSVGRLEKQKNFTSLIKVFTKSDISLDIVGEGSLKSSLKKTAFDSQTDLTLMGNLSYEELNKLYLNYRIFILSSFFEGNPKVVLEAFSRGTLVIAKNNKNTREIIENNVNGILFDDFKELNSKVNEIISNKTIFEKITSNAYEKVLKFNLISTIINQELDIYKKLNS